MFFHRSTVRGSIACTLLAALQATAAPIASDGTYPAIDEDTVLTTTPASGLMTYIAPNGVTGALSAVRVANAAHGNVIVNTDGSFSYTPAANYNGPDSFTYKAVESVGPILFNVVPANSILSINVVSDVSLTGVSDNKTTTVPASGTISAQLTPTSAPFSTAQIRTVDLGTASSATITICVAKLFGACVSELAATIPADGLSLNMRADQAGPPVPVDASGNFNQTGNRMDVVGDLVLSGGAVSLLGLAPNQSLNTTDMAIDFNNARIVQNGNTLELSMPVDVTQQLTDPNYTVNLHVTGTIRATAPVPAALPESNVATITLNVDPVDDVPVSAADRYYTRQNHTITPSGGSPQPVSETPIPAGSVWKYNTGTDLSTGWRAVDFVDTAWPSGAGVLGYDTDNPIATTIPKQAAGSTTVYPAAYFRKEVTLNAAGATTEAAIEFQRDDACIIFINGTEVYRDSTAYTAGGTAPFAATGEIAYTGYTGSTSSMSPDSDGAAYKRVVISPSVLREGKNVIAAMVKQSTDTSSDLRWDLILTRTYVPTDVLIAQGSAWKYATGASLGTTWRQPGYNDSTWLSAAGPLGYDADIPAASTIPARANTALAASAANPNYPTAYFRREFILAAPFDTIQPRVEFQRDDGCIIYLNGTEIYRDSTAYAAGGALPFPAAGEIDYATYAGANIPEADSLAYKSVTFPRALLREGVNVIAAEVHQVNNTSSDLRFDLRAFRTTGVGAVTANDTDIDGPAFNTAIHTAPAHGTVVLQPDGSFAYTPEPGYPASGASATDSFVYTHRDGTNQPFVATEIISPMAATWKYLDTGTPAPQDAGITAADWRHASYDDAAWKTGVAEFGYGEADQTTTVEDNATPGYVQGDTDRFITTYFRRKFTWGGSAALLNTLKVRAIRDDGIVIWLNGQRLAKDNMPETFDANTPASASVEGAPPITIANLPPGFLLEGENILAVEIHQERAASSDISFDMELSAESVAGAKVEIVVLNDDIDGDNMSDTWERANGIDDSVANAGADPDGDGQSNRLEFLAGTNPRAGSSVLRATSLVPSANPLLWNLTFNTVPGKFYSIEYSDRLDTWLPAGTTVEAHPTAATTTTQVLKPANIRTRFYRAVLTGDWD